MTTEATEATQRAQIVAEALTWLGTPYHHRAAIKGVGADCAQLPLAVYAAAGVIPTTDVGDYSVQWMLHREREIYLEWVRKFGTEIAIDQAGPGDFIIYRFGRTYSHGAIFIDPPFVIHAYIKAKKVTIDDITAHADLISHPALAFTFWPKP